MVAFTSMQREHILEAVQAMYTDVARVPEKGYHFPVGREACLVLGYQAEWLDRIPATAVESFAGVACPVQGDVFQAGDTVLDIGSGSGTDSLIAALRVGDRGRVYGLDMTDAMLAKFGSNIEKLGVHNVVRLRGNAEAIPLPDQSVDIITSNGVLNLVYDKPRVFADMYRVLRPGGRITISDISVSRDLETLEEAKNNPRLWAECVAGAVTDKDYLTELGKAGFEQLDVIDELDYFSHSSSEQTRQIARNFGAHSIVLRGIKPA
jgi:ubiquinone/menaquinone biosynthesis C-methylase UbiE